MDDEQEEVQIICHHWILWENNSQIQLWWPCNQGISIQSKCVGSKTLPSTIQKRWKKQPLVAHPFANATLQQIVNSSRRERLFLSQ